MKYQYLYGPIPSRRLGVSLGIDPIPHKTCPLNCIYCECGATNNFTIERKEYIPTKKLLKEIDHFMNHQPLPDFITFSGSGEPTLYIDLGKVIQYIHKNHPLVKVAVITNSSMLVDKNLCQELMLADLVVPSLDAISSDIFSAIDLPMESVNISAISDSLREFAQQFLDQCGKELWIEIFVIEGINDHYEELQKFVTTLSKIPYTQIHLNRLDRIGTKTDLVPASMKRLHEIKHYFELSGLHSIEIVGKCKKKDDLLFYNSSLEETILSSLSRRSMSLDDLQLMSQASIEDIGQHLDLLGSEYKVMQKIIDGKIVYKLFQ